MASKAPPVPPEQQSGKVHGHHAPDLHEESHADHAGDAGLNLKEQGRYGNIHQNVDDRGRQQDR